jgi:signal transduction histidine kinase
VERHRSLHAVDVGEDGGHGARKSKAWASPAASDVAYLPSGPGAGVGAFDGPARLAVKFWDAWPIGHSDMGSRGVALAVFGVLFDLGADAAFVIDPQQRVLLAGNARLHELVRAPDASLDGSDADQLIVASGRDEPRPILEVEGTYEDVALRRRDGEPVAVTLTVTHVEVPGHGRLVACLARDTTERLHLERELLAKHTALFAAHADLERMVAQLRAASRLLEERNREITALAGQVSRFGRRAAVGELVGGIAHHLNNPIGALASTMRRVSAAVADVAEPGPRGELEGLLRQCREIMSRIEGNVAAIVRAQQAGSADDSAAWLQLDHALDTAVAMFAHRLGEVQVERAYQVEVPVLVPHDALHHVMSNLIDNSLRAMPHGGRLAIAALARPQHVAVQVSDTGGGVPAELQGRLFEPLLGARPGGAGLGLSTARRLARAWGGDVVYTPRPDGACFEVRIPTFTAGQTEAGAS